VSGYVAQSAQGLALLLWAADPRVPERLATPFFHALAAAALEVEVEIYFSAASVQLLVPGVADRLRASVHSPRTIGEHLRAAHAAGARLLACTDALHAQGLSHDGLIPEVSGHGGAVQFTARVLDPRWRGLVF
jgi:hypothetical protein